MSIDEQSADQAQEIPESADDAVDFVPDDGSPSHDGEPEEIQPAYAHPPVPIFHPSTFNLSPVPRRTQIGAGWMALCLSIAFHAAVISIGILFFVRFSPPSWQFEKGDGTSTSDLSAVANDPSTGRAILPAAPTPGAADPDARLASKSQQSDNELLTAVPDNFVVSPVPAKQEPQEDPALFGIGATNPLSDPPARPKPATPAAAASQSEDSGNSTAAPTAPQLAAKPQMAMNAPVQKTHVWTDIHPSGTGGSGSRAGSRNGFDNRGLPIPEYPAESYRRGEEGLVVLEVEVRADGSVNEVTVVENAGYPRLASAAVEAVRTRAHFIPATYDGEPTIAKFKLPYRFVLIARN